MDDLPLQIGQVDSIGIGNPDHPDSGQTCQVGPGLPRLLLAMTLVPFISQMSRTPLLFWKRISDRPSLL